MKKLLVIFLLSLISNISSAQTGWGYVNYTSYKTHNGNGNTSQYTQFANTAADFDKMLNTAYSNTTITHTGEAPISYLYNGSLQVPHWSYDYFAFKFDFWFVPQETGTYSFGINSDDASDLSVDGTVITSYYGGHGASGYRIGTIDLVAGTKYKIVARFQEFGGGEAFYLNWSKPSAPNTYSYWVDEVTNIETVPTKQVKINFNSTTTLDKTKFSAGGKVLSSLGVVDVTNSIDSVKIGNGYKALTAGGQVEWAIIDVYSTNFGGHRLYIDAREFDGTGVTPSEVNSIKLFDIYDGPITYVQDAGGWKIFRIVPNISTKITASNYQSYLRLQNGWYGTSAEFTFSESQSYKPQSIKLTTTNNLATLYNSIVTVSDVWLAFKEVANTGIFGNESGKEFTYGIQYKNADVNDDGYFNEADAFIMLQHLTGAKNIVDTFALKNTLKLIPTTNYNNIGKSNWTSSPSYLNDTIDLDINTGKAIDTFNYSITWKGDVNLSHSATPLSNGITTMSVRTMSAIASTDVNASILTELSKGKLNVYITFDPLQQEVVGNQFQLNYDNSVLKFEGVEFKTKGSPMNYGTNKGSYINLGSLITDGSTLLDNTTEYKVVFTPIKTITNGLGLVGIEATDAVNKAGKQLNVKIQ